MVLRRIDFRFGSKLLPPNHLPQILIFNQYLSPIISDRIGLDRAKELKRWTRNEHIGIESGGAWLGDIVQPQSELQLSEAFHLLTVLMQNCEDRG